MPANRLPRVGLVVLAFLGLPALAAQAEDFFSGTYSTESGCQALAKKEGQSEFLYLKASGITGDGLECDFLNVAARSSKPGWVATTLCQEPTISYPELVSIVPLEDGRLQVASSQIADVDIAGDYQKCTAERP